MFRQDDDQEIDLFQWTGTAVARAKTLEEEITDLAGRYRLTDDTIQKLGQQLQDLIRAKDQHESQLMANFVLLLN